MRQRQLAAFVAGAGLVALLAYALAVPKPHDVCGEGIPGEGWAAIRGPQIGPAAVAWDEANRTTLLRPGCGHMGTSYALRVEGDHRGLDAGGHLVLRLADPDSPPASEVAHPALGPGQRLIVPAGTYAPVPLVAQAGLLALAAILVPAGAFLWRHARPACSLLPGAGGFAGLAAGYLAQRHWLMAGMGVPLLAIVVVPVAIYAFAKLQAVGTPRASAWAHACLGAAVAYLVAAFAFSGFPHAPEA